MGRSGARRRFHRAQPAAHDPESPAIQHQPLPAQQHLLSQLPLSGRGIGAGFRSHSRTVRGRENRRRNREPPCRAVRRIRAGGRAEAPALHLDLRGQPAGRGLQELDRGRGRTAAALCHLVRAGRTSACGKPRSVGLAGLARRIPRSREPRRKALRART